MNKENPLRMPGLFDCAEALKQKGEKIPLKKKKAHMVVQMTCDKKALDIWPIKAL